METRLASLDGLRGIAAVIVVAHHSMLVFPWVTTAVFGDPFTEGMLGLVVNSPLHLLWGGTEAVYLFFVLSGLVLALAAQAPRFDWASYFPSRMVRLYLPVIGAVAFAAVVLAFTPDPGPTSSPWVQLHPANYELAGMLLDVTLLGGTSGSISPLWSLQWEVIFSLLLPIYLFAARRGHPAAQILICIALSTLGAFTGVAALLCLPMFGIGVALASALPRIGALTARMTERLSTIAWSAAILVAIVMVTSHWSARLVMPIDLASWVTVPVILGGICILVVAAVHARGFRAMLSMRPVRFLGLISFSLYLVHEPILLFIAGVTGRPTLTLLITMPIAIAVAAAVWWAIERPAHRLARRVRAGASAELHLAA